LGIKYETRQAGPPKKTRQDNFKLDVERFRSHERMCELGRHGEESKGKLPIQVM